MKNKIDPEDLELSPFDPVDYLDNDEMIITYLSEAFDTGDEAFIIDAIGVAARAKGMSEIAEKAGLTRTSLYRGLSENGKPQFGTILAVMKALGLKLDAKAA